MCLQIISTWMIVCGCFTVYSLWTVVIQLHIYFTDWWGLLVFITTKTKTPELTVKFDQKLGGKDRTEDNLTN